MITLGQEVVSLAEHATGTTAAWTLVGIAITSFFTALGIWIKYGPDHKRAANEEKVIEGTEMDRVLANLQQQVHEYRAEVHAYRNEVQALQGELSAATKVSNQRSDRIDTLELIIELLLSELERIDPHSIIVRQAKIMLRRVSANDPAKSAALNVVEHAVADAKQTVRSTERAADEIRVNEAKAK